MTEPGALRSALHKVRRPWLDFLHPLGQIPTLCGGDAERDLTESNPEHTEKNLARTLHSTSPPFSFKRWWKGRPACKYFTLTTWLQPTEPTSAARADKPHQPSADKRTPMPKVSIGQGRAGDRKFWAAPAVAHRTTPVSDHCAQATQLQHQTF